MAQDTSAARGAFSQGREAWNAWPRYESAVLGFQNYWYPVMWSGQLRSKPQALTLLGQRIVFLRDRGKPYAVADRCPHRGVSLSHGCQNFPGTLSCAYHGWTYDLQSGDLVAVITDGPDSPIRGKVRVRTYPLEERLGLVWIYMGDGTPPPLEDDLPAELISQRAAIAGRITERKGNWRLAAENGFDEGHAKYLHRNTPFSWLREMPVWTRTRVVPVEDGKWITRVHDETHFATDFPGLGRFPAKKPWWKLRRGGARTSLSLPCMLRVKFVEWTHYEWYVPLDADHHRYIQIAVKLTTGLDALLFKLRYWLYIRWLFHGMFNDQDAIMVEDMDCPPERLYRPDVSIVAWRRMCEQPRGTDGRIEEVYEQEVEELETEPVNAG
jgi:phenylpropionate dioxygenase-like ring-hydroxylating dioxygenase large terminal subunit